MWRASDWKALAGRCIWQGERVFYATGRALTDIPHSADDARHRRRNSYMRPYANSGNTERRDNGDRFSAVVPGCAAWVVGSHDSVPRQDHHRASVSWSLARETGSRATGRPGPPLASALPRSTLCAGSSLSRRAFHLVPRREYALFSV